MKNILKSILRFLLPHAIFLLREKIKKKKLQLIRNKRIVKFNKMSSSFLDYDYELSIQKLVEKELDEEQIREGSIPENSLDFLFKTIMRKLYELAPIKVLHIGNFVGVSLLYITESILKINPSSIVVSIDPNISHRGINNPMKYVNYLLNQFGFQKNSIILTGYSLEKNISNDGNPLYFLKSDNTLNSESGYCSSSILENLIKIDANFNFALIDGNHEGNYLRREIELINKLLDKDGFLVIDDVNQNWEEVELVFQEIIKQQKYKFISTDNRIGIVQKLI
ncbi:hypothetical protein ACFLSS_00665 [Bacteroidota bacterium]